MNRSLLARRYAKALLSYALEVGEAEALYPLMKGLGRTLRPYSEEHLLDFVTNPTLTDQTRREALVEVLGGDVPESFRRFVDLVFSHKRESLLGEMARAYMVLYRKHKGITFVRVTSAVPLSEQALAKIQQVVRQRQGGEIEIEKEVDEQLLGGFTLRVDGMVLDGSAKRAIDRVRQQFIKKNKTIV